MVPDKDVEMLIDDHCAGTQAADNGLQKSIGTVNFVRALAQLLIFTLAEAAMATMSKPRLSREARDSTGLNSLSLFMI